MEIFQSKRSATMGLPSGIYWLLLALVLLINQDTVLAQTKRAPRAGPTSRSLGINPQRSSSASTSAAAVEFDCPEEFGYYPHPTDCSQYYVCVFGGALQESCTGGLMYSHELQTCDWPRNVGCEVSVRNSPAREDIPRLVQVPSRIRFSSVGSSGLTGPSGLANERQPQIQQQSQQQQQHQQKQQQHQQQQQQQQAVQAQIQQIQQLRTLPPPPEPLRVAPNPEITPRGQPKHLPQDDIVKLYAEAHDTLPLAEEEESDRQQRVYRGQPSTVGQVQRDRDGGIIVPSANAIPTQQKIGSFAFSTPPPYSDKQLQDLDDDNDQKLRDRKKRSVDANTTVVDPSDAVTLPPELQSITDMFPSIDISNFFESDDILEFLRNNSLIPIAGLEDLNFTEVDNGNSTEDGSRRARQLTTLSRAAQWPFVNQNNFRALDFFGGKQNSFFSQQSKPQNDGSFFISSTYKNTNNNNNNNNYNINNGNNNNNNNNNDGSHNPYIQNYNKNKHQADFKSASYSNNYNQQLNSNGNYKSTFKITPQDAIIPLYYTTPSSLVQYNSNNNNNNNYKSGKYTTVTTNEPENYAYYHLKKGSKDQSNSNNNFKSSTRNPFASFNPIGGFFNNQQQQQDSFRPSPQFATVTPHVTNLVSVSPYSANFNDDKKGFSSFQTQKLYPTTPLYSKNQHNVYSTPAPVYEHEKLNHPSQTVRYSTSTPKPLLVSNNPFGHNVFLNNINFKKPHQNSFVYQGASQPQPYTPAFGSAQHTTSKSNNFYIVKTTLNPTVKPIITSTTPRLIAQPPAGSLEFERLVSRIRNNHITVLNPKQISKNVTTLQQVPKFSVNNYFPSTRKPAVTDEDEYYDDDSEEEQDEKVNTRDKQPNKLNSPRPNYGYLSPVKPNYIKTNQNSIAVDHPKRPETQDTENEYDDEYYDDDDDEDSKPPPSIKPQYFPMSETMAPKPYNNYDFMRTTTPSLKYTKPETSTLSWKIRNEYKPAITTVAPPTSSIPSIIQFPDDDVFKGLIPRYLNKSTLRPYTVRHRVKPTNMPTTTEETTTVSTRARKTRPTTTTLRTTTSKAAVTGRPTTKKVYTVRPSRGNQRWKTTKSTNKRPDDNKLTKNNNKLEQDDKLPNRVESSTSAYIQQQKNVYSQPANNNKNYYNTTNYNPSNYDSYFSLYDDDVEVYRNVDYPSQQYNTQKPVVSSTYRPSTTVTATPQRDTYVAQPQPQQPQYERPAQQNIYNTDYDDALVAQLDDDNSYREPIKTQLRGDRNDINSISDSPLSSTLRTYNPKYSSPSFASTPEPFSLSSPVVTTPRPTTTTTTTTTYRTTTYSTSKAPQPQYVTQRSTLSEDISNNKTSPFITLAARAGPPETFHRSFSLKPIHDSSFIDRPSFITTPATNPQFHSNEQNPSPTQVSNLEQNVNFKHSQNIQTTQNAPKDLTTKLQFTSPSNVVSLSAGFIFNNEKSLKNNYFNENYVAKNRKNFAGYLQPSDGKTTLQKIVTTTTTTTTSTVRPEPKSTPSSTAKDFERQRNKLLSFIVSDVQPESFKPALPAAFTFNNNNNNNYNHSSKANNNKNYVTFSNSNNNRNFYYTLVNTTTERPTRLSPTSTTTQRVPYYELSKASTRTETTTEPQTTQRSSRLKYTQSPVDIVPLYNRANYEEQPYRASSDVEKKELAKSVEYLEATTYSPKKQWTLEWEEKISEPTKPPHRQYDDGKYRTKPITTTTTTTTELPPPATEDNQYKSFLESVQSFTSRGLIFKEALNKSLVPSTTAKQYVSPFKSLESLRQAVPVKSTSIKPILPTSTRSVVSFFRNTTTDTTTLPPPTTSTSPYRSYFLITNTPKIATLKHPASTKVYPTTTVASVNKRTTTSSTTRPTTTTTTTEPTTRTTTEQYYESNEQSVEFSSEGVTGPNRGRYRPYISYTTENTLETEDPTTYSPKLRYTVKHTSPQDYEVPKTTALPEEKPSRQKNYDFSYDKPRFVKKPESIDSKSSERPVAEELVTRRWHVTTTVATQQPNVVEITDKPIYFTKYTYQPRTNATYGKSVEEPVTKRFRATVEMPEMHVPTESEMKAFTESQSSKSEDVSDTEELLPYDEEEVEAYVEDSEPEDLEDYSFIETAITASPKEQTRRPVLETTTLKPTSKYTTTTRTTSSTTTTSTTTTSTTTFVSKPTTVAPTSTTTTVSSTTTVTNNPKIVVLPRASRVNSAIKTSIATASQPQRLQKPSATKTCSDNTPNAKCNEIPLRTNTRNRGNSQYTTADQGSTSNGRGTHPPRVARPTLKPSKTIVANAVEFVDIYRHPPSRPEALYPQPTPDKTAAKCRKDVCLLPDCYCGGKDVPGDLEPETVPQIVLLTFDDSVNDLNKGLYSDLFERGRVNPNGCPISATFYVSHEWTDYSQVQNLYSDGHEIASHTISHSFGEQFSIKKWAREVAGQREVIAAYGGVKLSDVKGMRAPFLSIGGNKMFKMLHDFNFTYDSSMPVYENRPPSYPYTLDYKIFHDCMIPPCPTKSYPGVWEVPMVMWQDLNGGRCSMGDACSNPADVENVFKMIMKNFERHYTTNRAPFGLFYHAAWFTQPHHKEGFIKFLDTINAMKDVYIVTNWQALQWVRDPTPLNRLSNFQPFQCNYQDRPKRCNNAKVCNLWHKSGVRYMRTCQPCPEIYPWTGKTGIRSSRIDNDLEIVESN